MQGDNEFSFTSLLSRYPTVAGTKPGLKIGSGNPSNPRLPCGWQELSCNCHCCLSGCAATGSWDQEPELGKVFRHLDVGCRAIACFSRSLFSINNIDDLLFVRICIDTWRQGSEHDQQWGS